MSNCNNWNKATVNVIAGGCCDCGCDGCCECNDCCDCGCGGCATFTLIRNDADCCDCGCECSPEPAPPNGCECTGTAWTSERCGCVCSC